MPPHRPGSQRQGRDERTWFDRFAERASRFVAHPFFFFGCAFSVVVWAFLGPATGFSDTWQLVINTSTTIVTFLMVALLQNSQRRAERAMHRKLDAIADALADFMDKSELELEEDVAELEEAVGLEQVQGSGDEAPRRRPTARSLALEGRPAAGRRRRGAGRRPSAGRRRAGRARAR